MKSVFPIVLTQESDCVLVYVPDMGINTEGSDIPDAMAMARDAIGLVGITLEDEGKAIPKASMLVDVRDKYKQGTVTLIDVDFTAYREENDRRTVRRNVSLPAWLNVKAEKAGLNVSAVLQKALKAELNI